MRSLSSAFVRRTRGSVLVAAILVIAASSVAFAAQLDAPALTYVESGFGRVDLVVTAGATGAPAGFTLWWMKRADFEANGSQWFEYGDPAQGDAYFVGVPTLNNFPGEPGTFLLGPNESITIQPGDIADETGVVSYSLEEHEYGTDYVYCVFANAATGWDQSGYSPNSSATTNGADANCTFTQGYWKNHEDQWPVSSLTLGSVSYTAAQLLSIFNKPVQGNGLISLAHQLIATKLNLAMGANPTDVLATVVAADALIGALVVPPVGSGFLAPATTSALTEVLDDFNNGIIGPGHCDDPAACCFADGTCQNIPPEDCTVAGGTPQGGGTSCATVVCAPPPPPRGACCTPSYSCLENVTASECAAAGGAWYSGATCAQIVCTPPPPRGACCTPNYICLESVTAAECASVGGVWYAGATCAEIVCTPPPPRGACCSPEFICLDGVTLEQCDAVFGTFYPDATCAGVVCVNATESKSWGRIKGLYR